MAPRASTILHSCLVGLDQLFGRVAIEAWQNEVRRVLELHDPAAIAEGYRRMSRGSAPGTFHDLIISEFNRHPVTEQQEPWVNELLTTFQAMASASARAIAGGGPDAKLPVTPSEAARQTPGFDGVAPELTDRRHVRVHAVDCQTCGSRFLLDTAVAEAAAKRWAVLTAPSMVAANRSTVLASIALDPASDALARRAIAEIRPAADRLDLLTIRMPYNRPAHQPDDRCPVCFAVA